MRKVSEANDSECARAWRRSPNGDRGRINPDRAFSEEMPLPLDDKKAASLSEIYFGNIKKDLKETLPLPVADK